MLLPLVVNLVSDNARHLFIKKETLTQVFSSEFCEVSKNNFSYRTPPVVVSVLRSIKLYTPIGNPITSQKMTLTVFSSFYCE